MSETQSVHELRPSPEQASIITASEITQTYNAFQRKIKGGYPTAAEELREYHHLLDRTASFFLQDGNTESLVQMFFAKHDELADAPVAFFGDIGKALNEQGELEGRAKYDYIADALRAEAHDISVSLRAEDEAIKKLEYLDGVHADRNLPDVTVTPISDRRKSIKDSALNAIAQEPSLASTFTALTEYKTALDELTTDPSANPITKLDRYKQLVGVDILTDIDLHMFTGDTAYVQTKIQDLATEARSPDFTWEQLVKRDDFPSDLYHSFETLATLAEMAEVAVQLEGQPPEVKAHFLLPYAQKGVSGFLLQEMAEGRFTIADDFLTQQVETFIDFSENVTHTVESQIHTPAGKMKKTIAAVLAAGAFSLPMIAPALVTYEVSKPALNTTQTYGEPPEKQVNPPAHPGSTTSSHSLHPEISSPEDFLGGLKTEYWSLEGNDLLGLYKEGVASKYDTNTRTWDITQTPIEETENSGIQSSEITLTGQRDLISEIVPLHIKTHYTLTKGSVEIDGISGNYAIQETTGGNYIIRFSPEDKGKTVTIKYSIGRDVGDGPMPSADELKMMSETAFTIDQINDQHMREFMEELAASDDSNHNKIGDLKRYIQDHFLYSLNPAVSQGYDKAPTTVDYFNRILYTKHGDCDVVNSTSIMLLRSIGIPARLVSGSLHAADFEGSKPESITAMENHAWIEAFVDDRWVTLDTTPSNMDDYTKKAIGDKTKDSSGPRNSLDDFESPLKYTWFGHSGQEGSDLGLGTDIPIAELSLLLGLLTIEIGAYNINMFAKRKNEKRKQKLINLVADRTKEYLGEGANRVFQEYFNLAKRRSTDLYSHYVKTTAAHFIPFLGVLKERRRAKQLQNVPYAKNLPPVRTTTSPNAAAYIREVLGYDDNSKKVDLLVLNAAHFDTRSVISNEQNRIVNEMDTTRRAYNNLHGILRKIRLPSSDADWGTQKRAVHEEIGLVKGIVINKHTERLIEQALFARLVQIHCEVLTHNPTSPTTHDLIQRDLAAREEKTEPDDEQTTKDLTEAVQQYLYQAPLMSRTENQTITGTGSVTPQGRRIIAKDILQGRASNPHDYREAEVDIEGSTGIQTSVIHWVDLVGPQEVFDTDKRHVVENTSQWLESVLSQGQITYTSADGQQDRRTDVKVVVHLVEQNLFGQYAINEFEINSASDIDKLKEAYKTARFQSVEWNNNSDMISLPQTARMLLGTSIVDSIKADPAAGEYPIPLFLNDSLATTCKGKPHIRSTQYGVELKK